MSATAQHAQCPCRQSSFVQQPSHIPLIAPLPHTRAPSHTADQLGGVTTPIASPTDPSDTLTVAQYVEAVFGIAGGGAGGFPGAWGAVGMLGVLCGAYAAASYLALRLLRHDKR